MIYKNRYQAEKARRESPYYSMSDRIVKCESGYCIMTPSEYNMMLKHRSRKVCK